jgi:hypothetical protein
MLCHRPGMMSNDFQFISLTTPASSWEAENSSSALQERLQCTSWQCVAPAASNTINESKMERRRTDVCMRPACAAVVLCLNSCAQSVCPVVLAGHQMWRLLSSMLAYV